MPKKFKSWKRYLHQKPQQHKNFLFQQGSYQFVVTEKYCNPLVAEAESVSPVTKISKILKFVVIDDHLKEISRNFHGEI